MGCRVASPSPAVVGRVLGMDAGKGRCLSVGLSYGNGNLALFSLVRIKRKNIDLRLRRFAWLHGCIDEAVTMDR